LRLVSEIEIAHGHAFSIHDFVGFDRHHVWLPGHPANLIHNLFVVAGWRRLPIDAHRGSTPRPNDFIAGTTWRLAPSNGRQHEEHHDQGAYKRRPHQDRGPLAPSPKLGDLTGVWVLQSRRRRRRVSHCEWM